MAYSSIFPLFYIYIHRTFGKGNPKLAQKLFHAHYCLDGHSGIEDWYFVIFQQCETHAQLKETETFRQNRLKTFYPVGVNEKEEYLYSQKKIFS